MATSSGPNRQPIDTEVFEFNADKIKEAIEFEVYRGGQVFFIHNRVRDIEEVAGMLRNLCPTVDFSVAHGQMDGEQLEQKMEILRKRKRGGYNDNRIDEDDHYYD